jgi:hypothetical protein
MDNQLENLYESMLQEASKTGTVDTKVKAGEGFEGSDKAQGSAIKSPKPTDAEGVTKKTPDAGPSQGKGQGKPEKLSKKVESMETSKDELIPLTFDQLFKRTIKEEDESIVPSADIEGDEFSEDTGDFEPDGGEGDVEEEIDLASELRILADRLSEIADKIGVDEEGGVGDGIEDASIGDEELGGAGEEVMAPESVQHKNRKVVKEAIKSEPTPKNLKKTTLGPKMSQNPKNKIGKSGAGKASTPAAKDRTGTPSVAPKTTFGPKMSQNPNGTGPAVKGAQAPLVN